MTGKVRGRKPKPLAERMKNYTVTEAGCWVWQGTIEASGYGRLWVGSRVDGTRRPVLAHRVSYELHKGEIPDGLPLDHLCRNPPCINPDHLEPVTLAENMYRGEAPAAENKRRTHCIHGHEFTPENTYAYRGKRYCRECRRRRNATEARRVRSDTHR